MAHHQPRHGSRDRATLAAVAALAATLLAAGSAIAAGTIAPPPDIAKAGSIVFCSDMTGPPLEFLDESTKPVGSDIDIGNEIAQRFGVKAEWKNLPFKGLVPALLAKQCDAVISQLFDKPARRETIGLVDYMFSSEALLVQAGNPKKIHGLEDLSGMKVAVENGTTEQDLLQEQSDKFKAAGKKPIDIVVFPKDTDALQQLQIGQADVYATTLETGTYYMTKAPGTFEVAGPPFHQILTGIGIRKDDTALQEAVQKAVDAMKADGTLLKILTKWHLEGDKMS
ncbi:MAG: ABC transporter substrate-binding protein [Alphaproteobacteria bacterium]|nr:ABC transporter substrate-binding protein [Alphaproteobacteria bacterium]